MLDGVLNSCPQSSINNWVTYRWHFFFLLPGIESYEIRANTGSLLESCRSLWCAYRCPIYFTYACALICWSVPSYIIGTNKFLKIFWKLNLYKRKSKNCFKMFNKYLITIERICAEDTAWHKGEVGLISLCWYGQVRAWKGFYLVSCHAILKNIFTVKVFSAVQSGQRGSFGAFFLLQKQGT